MAVLHNGRILSPVPSESAQSQILNEDDSDEETGFATQLPLASITQASLTTASTDAVQTTPPLTRSPKDANSQLSSEPQSSQKKNQSSHHRHIQPDPPNSSTESVPFKALTQHVASSDQNYRAGYARATDSSSPDERLQSLPLIDQLRAIRKGTNYTRSLGWAKHIEPSQRKILDSNGAWQPPLPGKASRDGTVPVVLLERLSNKANEEVKRAKTQSAAEKDVQSLRTRGVRTEPIAIQPVASQEAHSPVTQTARKGSVAPEVFVDSQEWPASVSPEPRHVLPPDSSPVQPGIRQDAQPLTQTNSEENRPPVATKDPNDGTQSHLGHERPIVAHTQATETEHPSLQSLKRLLVMSELDTTTLSSPTPPARKASGTQHKSLNSTRTPPATVQAKQTPYMVKSPQVHTQLGDEPVLSVVNGTYVEPKRPSVAFAPTPSPLAHPSVRLSAHKPRDRILSASHAQDTRKGETSERNRSSPDNTPARLTQPPTGSKRPRQSSNDSPVPNNSSATKRRKLPWASTDNDGQQISSDDYKELEQNHMPYRRQFHREHSKSYKRPILVPQDDRTSHPYTLGSVSVASSPPNALQALETSHSSRAASQKTAETSSSIHDPLPSDNPIQAAGARATNTNTSETDHTSNLLSSYRAVYKSYSGSSTHFHAAVRLLLKLKEEKREPHPALWDDFVFRQHSSYGEYLRDCIEDGESAMPYEKFYHEKVPQPKCLAGVLTPANIEASLTTPGTPYKLPTSNGPAVTSVQTSHRSKSSLKPRKTTERDEAISTSDKVTQNLHSRNTREDQNVASSGKTRAQIQTDSSRKVSTWLHRAPGAQSPELGSSVPDQDELPANIVPLTEDNLSQNATQAKIRPPTDKAAGNRRLNRKADDEGAHSTTSSNAVVLDFIDRYKKLPGERPHLATRSRSFNIYDW